MTENYEQWKQNIAEVSTLEDRDLSIDLVEGYPELKIDKFTTSPMFLYNQKAYPCFSTYVDSLDDVAKKLLGFAGRIVLYMVTKRPFDEGVYVRYALLDEEE